MCKTLWTMLNSKAKPSLKRKFCCGVPNQKLVFLGRMTLDLFDIRQSKADICVRKCVTNLRNFINTLHPNDDKIIFWLGLA